MARDQQNPKGSRRLAQWPAVLAGAIVLVLAANQLAAQSGVDTRLLTPREQQRLSKAAREVYDKGVKALDHIDPILAIELFDKASKLDSKALELHFLVARLALIRGRTVYGSDAKKYYDIAEKALERVRKIKNLSILVKRHYEVQNRLVTKEKKELEIRDSRRKQIGSILRIQYAAEVFGTGEEKTEAKPAQRVPRPPVPPGRFGPVVPRGGGGRRGGGDTES